MAALSASLQSSILKSPQTELNTRTRKPPKQQSTPPPHKNMTLISCCMKTNLEVKIM